MKLNPNKTGLALGILVGGIHLVWSLLVAFGWAQEIADFVASIHMTEPVLLVGPFDLSLATVLVVLSGIIGYVVGHAFALISNHLHR